MSATSNMQKNTFGKKKRKSKIPLTKNTMLMKKIANQVYESKEKKEVELKAYDNISGIQTVNHQPGYMHPVTSNMVTGVGAAQRIGSEIYVKGVLLRVRYQQSLPPEIWNQIRTIVLRWNCSGVPTAANVLQSNIGGAGFIYTPLSPLIRDASQKFQVLYDNLIMIGSECETSHMVDKIYIKNPGRCIWDDNNNPQKGQIFVLFISGSNVNVPAVQVISRAKFTD